MMKRLAIALVLCLVFSLVPVTALAVTETASGTCGDNLTWVLEEGTLTISGTGEMYDYGIFDTVWSEYCEIITTVEIQEGVTTIGDSAFSGLYCVTEFTLPASITEIGRWAFCCCYALQEIEIPEDVTVIGYRAFENCDALTFVNIPAGVAYIGECAFYGCSALTDIPVAADNPYYTNDDQGALLDKELQYLIKVPVDVEGHYVIADSVTDIDSNAFINCAKLEEITLGSGVQNLQPGEFYNCSSLTAFHVNADNTCYCTDEQGVLYTWDQQKLLRVPAMLSGSYTIPAWVMEIDTCALQGCQNLTEVVIPAATGKIGWAAFSDCTNLREIYFRGNLPEMDYEWIFNNLTATVYYPEGNDTWTEEVRLDYDGSITWVPYSVTYRVLDQGACGSSLTWKMMENRTLMITGTGAMDDYSFEYHPWKAYADWFTTVEIGSKVTSLGEYAFHDCAELESVLIPASVTAIGKCAFDACDSLQAINVAADNPVFSSDDRGVLYNKDKTVLLRAPHCLEGHYTIPDSVTALGYGAFKDCNLETVTFPATLTVIPERAFDGCYNLTEITIPDSVTTIEEAAFMSCSKLSAVTIPDSVTTIGSLAFWGCSESYGITIGVGDSTVVGPGEGNLEEPDGDEGLKEVYIGKNVTTIGTGAFGNCQQLEFIHVDPRNAAYCNDNRGVLFDREKTTLVQAPGGLSGHYTIPGSVTEIGEWAMALCPGLTGVRIPSGVARIGDYAFSAHDTLYFDFSTKLEEIHFCGEAPEIGYLAFWDIEANVSYPGNYASWTDERKQDHGGALNWVPYVAPTAKFTTISTSLGGNIAMNFYLKLSEDLVADPDAYIQFTYAGKTLKVPMSEGVLSGGVYRFACPITSKNMTDDITAQVYNADGPVGASKTMDVATYCNWVIANYTDAKTVNLMKAMLNYGASAQLLFKYRTDDLANAALSDADKVLGKVDASAYIHSRTGEEEGIKPTTYTLLLDSETTVRVYFQLTGTKSIEEYTFTVDGVEVEPVYKDGLYYIQKTDIGAHRLDELHVFTCGNITIRYGGLSYVNQVMTYYTEGTTFDMASALYAYSKAAEAYIG